MGWKKRGWSGGRRLFKRLGGAGQREKKGRGPCGGGRVEKEDEGSWGGRGAAVSSMGRSAMPPTVGRGKWHCRANREGGGHGRRGADGWRVGPREMRDPVLAAGCRRESGRERPGGDGAPTGGPGQHCAEVVVQTVFWTDSKHLNGSHEFKNLSNFDWLKMYFPLLQKFETKYGWKVFEMRNNFAYRNFLIFEMDFELKFREASTSWISIEIH
jgi:hypothetical protein